MKHETESTRLDFNQQNQRRKSLSSKFVAEKIVSVDRSSVTRLGASSPLWRDLIKLWTFGKGSFTIGQNFEHTLANIKWFWANVHCYKWPNIGPIN